MTAQPAVLLASCAELPNSDGDDTDLPEVLAELGVRASWAVWDAPETEFAAAELVVLRCTWDYTGRRGEFLRWCESVPALSNPAGVVRWNTDKSYLVDLADAGVPTVPTRLVEPGGTVRWPEGEFVLKPAVGAGSRGAARFRSSAPEAAAEHLRALHEQGRAAVLQPYQGDVDAQGETALVFIAGVYSHGFVKGPMLEPPRANGSAPFLGRGLRPDDPAPALRCAAENALDAACGLLGLRRTELLYARVDMVRGHDGAPLLLELELSEPSLGFRQTGTQAKRRFASAVRAFLARR